MTKKGFRGLRVTAKGLLSTVLMAATCASWALEAADCLNDAIAPTTPSGDFTVLSPGVVRHERTGLEWQRCAVGQEWNDSEETCSGSPSLTSWQGSLVASTESDWRLPNIKELGSIVERCQGNPSINSVVFPNTVVSPDNPEDRFWTSSSAKSQFQAWSISFDIGWDAQDTKTLTRRVRLVRDGQ